MGEKLQATKSNKHHFFLYESLLLIFLEVIHQTNTSKHLYGIQWLLIIKFMSQYNANACEYLREYCSAIDALLDKSSVWVAVV